MQTNKHLLIYIIAMVNGDWIKLHHFTPTQLNIVKSDPVTTVVSSTINKEYSNLKFDNESISPSSLADIAESKVQNEDVPSLIDSSIKDPLLGTYWVISQQDDSSLRGKLIFLQNIKEHLLQNIWEQSKTLWSRRTDARSMLGFPSMEGALVTIAFLTFAVFLIKIVQQFVQGLQGISPNTIGFQLPNANTGNTGARHRRHFRTNEETAKIFQYMDEFKIHHEL